jgi:tetratricopeptide (TPR) repeat protein
VPLPIATILFGLGAAALKAKRAASSGKDSDGPAGIATEIGGELATVMFAHLATGHVERMQERFAEWIRGNPIPENEHLERALAKSAALADLFCLMEAAPGPIADPEGKTWWRPVQALCPQALLTPPIQGFFAAADEAQIRAAKASCKARLEDLEEHFRATGIDAAQLLKPTPDGDYCARIAGESLAELEKNHGALPQRVHEVFAASWFRYLCLAFQHELKEDQRVYRIFTATRLEAVFERLEDAIHDEGRQTREHIDESIERAIRPVAPFGYALPALGLFVGRDAESESAVNRWLSSGTHALLIWGPAGIGKSKLALSLLWHPEAVRRFGARRYRIRCDSYASADALVAGMGMEWFGIEPSPALPGQVIARLSEGPAAIVVDNLETPFRTDPAATEQWLQRLLGIPELWLAAGIQGHHRPGGVHWGEPHEPARLPLDAARDLFCGITCRPAHRADPRLDSLLRDLDGVPHAIELLAHQAVDDDLGELVQRWREEHTDLLVRAGGATREHSIRVAYEFAIGSRLMNEAAQRLLRVLACLPGGLAEADVPMVTGPMDGVSPRAAESTLKQHALAFAEAGRLRMLSPLRLYVQDRHPAESFETVAARKLFLKLAAEGEKVGASGGGDASLKLMAEYANASWAVSTALEAGDPEAIDAARGMAQFSRLSGVGEAELLERARELAYRRGDRLGEANCVLSLGDIALARSDHAAARQRFEDALPIYREVGARSGEANCIHGLGEIALARSDHAAARQRFEDALPIYREVGARLGRANCIKSLGNIALARSDHAGARQRFEDALPIYHEAGDRLGEANCIKGLGEIALARSDHAAARQRFEDALPIYREVGNRRGEANCIYQLGNIALARSDHAAAHQRFEDALPIYREVGDPQGAANCIQSVGDIALARSDYARARQQFEDALAIYRKVGDRLGEANCIYRLGEIALARSDHGAARQRFEDALAIYGEVGDRLGAANCIYQLGNIALRCGDHAVARQRFEDALPIYSEVGARQGEANCIYQLGNIALARNDHAAARQRFEDALPIYRGVGDRLGEANCIISLGDIALARSDHAAARQRFEDALPIYREVGNRLGEANCIHSLGDIALAGGDAEEACLNFQDALALYGSIPEPYSMGRTLRRLARLEADSARRRELLAKAIECWRGIGFDRLIDDLRREFPGEYPD